MRLRPQGTMVRWTMRCTANSPWSTGLNGWSNSMNLLWLGDPKSFDVALVGGKAANLNRLARMYHRVPDGFCLPVTVMDEVHPRNHRFYLGPHGLSRLARLYRGCAFFRCG